MNTMTDVSVAFKTSAKSLLEFQEQLEHKAPLREEMGKGVELKTLCETRWASRADCLSVFVRSTKLLWTHYT